MRLLLWIVALLPVAFCHAQTADTAHVFFDTDDPFLNAGGSHSANADDIGRALRVYVLACTLHGALYAALVVCL